MNARMIGLSGFLLLLGLPTRAVDSRYAFGLTLPQFISMSATNAAQGYRPISIDANGPTNSPNIAAVWINDGFTNWTVVQGVTRADYSNQVTTLTGQGYRTLCIDAYGDYPDERYMAVWVKDAQVATGWAQVFALTEDGYVAAFYNYWTNADYRPIWISVIATNGSARYSGAWVKREPGYGLSLYINMTAADLTNRVTDLVIKGQRPICFSGYNPSGTPLFAACWVFAEQPVWTWNSELNAAGFQAVASNLSGNGYRPVCINEYGPANDPRYASAWVQDSPPAVWTTAGMANTSLAALDNEMANFMALRNIKRGTLAVTRNGKLVFDRAYTWGPTNLAPTQTTNLFRIIALTRQLTSVAIFQLIQAGVISLDQPIGTILDLSTALDPQFATVTIRQLLQDWGGWDSNVSGDPMYRDDFVISANLNQPLPTTPQIIFDYMKYQFLNYAPGTSNVFSNFGYSLLGRIIETVTGMSYEQFVKANVLAPAGIWDTRLGKSLLADADPAEVDYEDPFNRIVASVMGTNSPAMVPIQYGGFNLSSGDACFAWLASAADLVRFSSSFDVQTNSPLLPPDLISTMWSQPPELSGSPPTYYGAGWLVRPLGGGAYNAWHDGYADGSFSYTVRRADGFCWAVLFNRFDNSGIVPNYYNIDAEMNNAVNSVVSWPAYDLFDANGDGILDAWQVRYFGSATSPAAAPGADPDGDGLNNLNEYINLTDPTNPASVTRLGASQVANSQSVGLDWFAARGRLYTIETSTNLASAAWQPLAAAIDMVGANAQATITDTPITRTFYRLKTRLQRP